VHVFGLGNQNITNQLKNYHDLYPSRILLHGYESKSINIYNKFSIYVNLGKLETFGRTTIEAMSAGCIVFGRRSGATPELINHGVNGFLFDEIFEIFEILNEYHSEGRHEELKIIQSNAVEFSKEFSSEKITQQFLLLLNSKSVNCQNKSK
jgi:glycosyltransferase involved in cell wall biosynthesis